MTASRLSAVLILAALGFMSILGCSEKARVSAPPPPEVIVSHALKKEVTEFLEFTGTTSALELVEIRARVEGWLESMHFTPGARVKKGQLLFIIDPRPFQARVDQYEAALNGKDADLKLKEANLKRAQQLLATAAISQLQYDVQSAEEAVAAAQVGISKADLEKAKLDLAYTRVESPIDGTVSRNYVDIGNLVGGSVKTLLTDVVNDSSVYVYFDVSEQELLTLMRRWPKAQQDVAKDRERPEALLQLADETGFPHVGRIDFAESRMDTSTGTLKVRAIFPNDSGLLVAGLFGRVRVPIQKKEALLVPEVAVGISQAGRFVLVVGKNDVVEQRLVETGQLEGALRVINKGLAAEDWVVVNGLQRAIPGSKVTPKKSSKESKPAKSGDSAPSSKK